MCVAVQMALLVSCLCHAPTLGAHRKPPCRMAEQVSRSGFSWKNTLESADGMSAADILHVRQGENYLVTDFTRSERLRDDPAA